MGITDGILGCLCTSYLMRAMRSSLPTDDWQGVTLPTIRAILILISVLL